MNYRKLVVGVIGLFAIVGVLISGHTSGFGPDRFAREHKTRDRLVPTPASRLGKSGVLTTLNQSNSDLSQGEGVKVPDYIVYSQLFRIVVLFKQKAEEEERQGKNGAVYRQAGQAIFQLKETEARDLEEIAMAWASDLEKLTAEAETVLTSHRAQRSEAKSHANNSAEPTVTLQQLYERFEASTLEAKERLRDRLGIDPFERFEKTVEENVTAHIKSRPVDSKNPDLPTGQPRGVGTDPSTLVKPSGVGSGDTIIREPAGKSDISPQATKPSRVSRDQDPAFNFCFWGGIVFYGTFLWLVPQVDQVLQLSFTQLDFCAGLSFDPYVYGALFYTSNFFFAEDNESFGRSFWRPAIILNTAPAFPSTLYSAYAEHWILRCGALQPTFQPAYCDWFFVDSYWVQDVTPACVTGAPMALSPYFNICPGPSPSPTPTPVVRISEVGFTGDFTITKWRNASSEREKIDFPDGRNATWSRKKNPEFPVAYKRGTNPVMFAIFDVTPPQNTGRPAQIRVKKGAAVVATKENVNIGGGQARVDDIQVTGALESGPVVKRGEYKFTWEISFDGGTNWANAGTSGTHKIYWTWDTPLGCPFRNRTNRDCFPTADPADPGCDTLYDEALIHSAGEVGSGSSDLAEVIRRITSGADSDFIYDPCKIEDADLHPLSIVTTGRTGQCSAQANLLRGLLRSIGINATTHYFWGGEPTTGVAYLYNFPGSTIPVTFQTKRDASPEGTNVSGGRCPNVGKDPHFSFHAVVCVGEQCGAEQPTGDLYDPSYGLSPQSNPITSDVSLLEVSNFPNSGFLTGTAANTRRVRRLNIRNEEPENPPVCGALNFSYSEQNTNRTCGHSLSAGVLFPNPIDEAQFFVEQHYADFLNRQSDPGGLAHWTNEITSCNGDPGCIDFRRTNTSVAFLVSPEFQETGFFVQRFYKASYARNPEFEEYLPDLGEVAHLAHATLEPEQLEINKQNYADLWVQSDAFKTEYPFEMEHAAYVDTLFANAGITPSPEERASLITGLEAETETRATVLRRVVDNQAFKNAEFNRAYILMSYFGYLRRTPDNDGYNFWLGILNSENDLHHISRAFNVCSEYRTRFGLP